MSIPADHRLAEAKAMPIKDVADLLHIQQLTRAGREWTGPCPSCGGDDRFSINTAKNLFNCRICGAKGDQVHLVMLVQGLDFRAALDWLCGPTQALSPAERAKRERRADENRQRQVERANRYREDAIRAARTIWSEAVPAIGTPVQAYLALRGISPEIFDDLPASIRFHPACRYMIQRGDRAWHEIHCGPAMIAAVQGADGKFSGVHRTWFDLADPKGKARIADPDSGAPLKSKKTLGAIKGGAIRLSPVGAQAPVLVMGEGIETTLSALVSGLPPDAVYWAGVSLGNLSGGRIMGQGKRFAGIPDMADHEAFVPPPWVHELILIRDGDSEPKSTQAKLLAGARRAMAVRPGLRARIVRVPEGMDLNDVLMGVPNG